MDVNPYQSKWCTEFPLPSPLPPSITLPHHLASGAEHVCPFWLKTSGEEQYTSKVKEHRERRGKNLLCARTGQCSLLIIPSSLLLF